MQYLDRLLTSVSVRQNYESPSSISSEDDDDKSQLSARNLYTYLTKVMYKRRSDFNPLWNQILVAGLDEEDKPFLASVDLLGTTFSSPSIATGFGAHLAQPLLRRHVPDEESVAKLDREKAVEVVQECMKVLFYRDARSLDEYSIATIGKDGVTLKENVKLEKQSWQFADLIKGYGTQTV
jgi:20S proteasome subunit beta 7